MSGNTQMLRLPLELLRGLMLKAEARVLCAERFIRGEITEERPEEGEEFVL